MPVECDTMRWEDVTVRMKLEVRPEDNPELGLPEKVTTRRGITLCGPIENIQKMTMDDVMALEMKGGMRALEYFLRQAGYIE
jgi:hypothetical protein